MLEYIKDSLMDFLSDKYFDSEWKEKTGMGNFNRDLKEEYKIPFFSLGSFRGIPNTFMLIQSKSIKGERSLLPNIGSVYWGSDIVLNVYIESAVTPENASITGDVYMDRLYKCFQDFIYECKSFTPVNPKASINKYYESGGKSMRDFNSITKMIVSGDLAFITKREHFKE